MVYLPTNPTPQLQSFSAPLLNLQDTYVDAPFFGANFWAGTVKPVTGGGIPAHHAFVEIKMTFKDGGAYDFDSTFKTVRDELRHAIEIAQESGRATRRNRDVNLSDVNLDQLPAYKEVSEAATIPAGPLDSQTQAPFFDSPLSSSSSNLIPTTSPRQQQHYEPPNEPPPGYEEAQRSSISNSLEDSERQGN